MSPASRPALLLLFATALAGAFWRAPTPAAPAFEPPPAARPSPLPALFAAEMLAQADQSAAAPTLAELPDGRLAAAWLAGPDDERVIRFSLLERAGWRPVATIASRGSTAGGTFAYVSRVDHPVLYAEGSWLHLWYSSAVIGSVASSSINHSVSTDAGQSWVKPTRLQTSPLANLGSDVRTPPLPLADGGLLLPVSHRLIARHGESLRLAPTGKILDKARLPSPATTWQPAVATLDAQRALAVLRDAGESKVQTATTANGGQQWQAGETLPIPNLDTPLALLRLKSGRLLLAGNAANGRQSLHLWISADDGRHWQASRSVEAAADGGAEFTDPALLLGRDGRIHLAYAWRRQGIRHLGFSEAWLDGGQP
jgi:predicted neuraminidase